MKDGLNPYASESAAALNQMELARLQDVGKVAQKILKMFSKLSGSAIQSAFPNLSGSASSAICSLSAWLIDQTTQSEKFNAESFAYHCAADLQRQGIQIDELFDSVRNLEIFLEGARNAKNAASRDKVLRLAQVVVSGILSQDYDGKEERVAEFIRFASELNETDIQVLKEMCSYQERLNPKFPNDWAQGVRHAMNNRTLLNQSRQPYDDQTVRSACARLQALGIVGQIGGTVTDTSPGETPYGVLNLGKEFLEYLRCEGTNA